MSASAVTPTTSHRRTRRLAAAAATLLIAVGLTACSAAVTDAVNTTQQLGRSGIVVHGLESTSNDDLTARVSVLSDRPLADVARTTAAIVWKTFPIRITRLVVEAQGPQAELVQKYDRQQLEAAYGPRGARLDSSVEAVAVSAAAGVLKVGAIVLVAGMLLVLSGVVLLVRHSRVRG